MQEGNENLLQGDVFAMLAAAALQASQEIETQQSLPTTAREKRDLLQRKDNLFKGTPPMPVSPCRLYDESDGDSS